MLTRIDNFLQKIANWKTVLALFFMIFPLGFYIDSRMFYKVPLLDHLPSYDYEKAYSIISYLYEWHKTAYIRYELTFQTFFPFVAALFSVTFVYYLGREFVPKNVLLVLALPLPIITLFVDYLENIGIIILVYNYPKELNSIVEITSRFATIKNFLWNIEWYVFFIGIIIYVIKAFRAVLYEIGVLDKNKNTAFTNNRSDA
jgi:hypothetical protein